MAEDSPEGCSQGPSSVQTTVISAGLSLPFPALCLMVPIVHVCVCVHAYVCLCVRVYECVPVSECCKCVGEGDTWSIAYEVCPWDTTGHTCGSHQLPQAAACVVRPVNAALNTEMALGTRRFPPPCLWLQHLFFFSLFPSRCQAQRKGQR